MDKLNEVYETENQTEIDDIKKFTKDADVIYFATDPDREGEAISKHLYDILDKAKILKEKEAAKAETIKQSVVKKDMVEEKKPEKKKSCSCC